MSKNTPPSKQLRISQAILTALAIAAVLAGLASLADLSSTTSDTRVVETWRTIGLFTFGALFGLLADKPAGNNGLWSVVIINKLTLTIAGIFYVSKDYAGAMDLVTFDGTITALLLVAATLAGVWKPSK